MVSKYSVNSVSQLPAKCNCSATADLGPQFGQLHGVALDLDTGRDSLHHLGPEKGGQSMPSQDQSRPGGQMSPSQGGKRGRSPKCIHSSKYRHSGNVQSIRVCKFIVHSCLIQCIVILKTALKIIGDKTTQVRHPQLIMYFLLTQYVVNLIQILKTGKKHYYVST